MVIIFFENQIPQIVPVYV